jgi:Tachylectin
MSVRHIFYGGNGTTPADGGLPDVGRFFAVSEDGHLRFFHYDGDGERDPSGAQGFRPNTGNTIGNGFQSVLHAVGGGDGIILAIQPNGDLIFFRYTGDGEQDPTGTLGFESSNNQGNQIGNGFENVRHLFVSPREGPATTPKTTIFAVDENGDLRWFRYSGSGEQDPTGTLGFEEPNQGNQIGRGFESIRQVVGLGDGAFVTVDESGDLRWFRYSGNGEQDRTGALGFEGPNQGNQIGNGFQGVRHLFGGLTDHDGPGRILYAITAGGDLLYFRYDGSGEQDPTGTLGFERPNQGNQIGRGF